MKIIELSRGKQVLVDDEDFEKINKHKWYAHSSGGRWYAVRTIWGKHRRMIYMHREVLDTPKHCHTDHINGNSIDNRKYNLRVCNSQQNSFNRISPTKSNKTGIKGTCWNVNAKKFSAQIVIDRKKTHLGYFTVLGDADQAYREAEFKQFGDFAREETKNYYGKEKNE